MIAGVVNASLEAVISLAVQGPSGQTRDVDAVIDTGYSGTLTLPPSIVAELGLSFRSSGRAILANGTEDAFSPMTRRSCGTARFGRWRLTR